MIIKVACRARTAQEILGLIISVIVLDATCALLIITVRARQTGIMTRLALLELFLVRKPVLTGALILIVRLFYSIGLGWASQTEVGLSFASFAGVQTRSACF